MLDTIEQGTAEWKAIKCGKVGASHISDIMAKGRSGAPSASRANYLSQLVAERLTGIPTEGFTSAAMEAGTANEAEARAAYAFYSGNDVKQVGFIPHPTVPMAGASPDGLVNDDGLVEIKAPLLATHIETLTGGSVPGKYMLQMQWQLACTTRLWCDFASFNPHMPEEMRLFVQRISRDHAKIIEVTAEVTRFLAEVDAMVAKLRKLYPSMAEAA